MKNTVLLVAASLACLYSLPIFGETPAGEYPSLNSASRNIYSEAAKHVIHQQSDLRLDHCSPKVLMDRIKRNVCIFDVAAFVENEAGILNSQEIKIGPDMKLSDVLARVGLSNWKPGRPQIRILKKNCMSQSPVPREEAKGQVSEFLGTTVSPGDMIILARQE